MPAQLLAAEAGGNPTPLSGEIGSAPTALKVEGNLLVANGRPIRLRGINWGWWHLSRTRYSEPDMQHLAQWGANTVRLAFSYSDLETDGNPAVWKEDGFKQLDEVVQWAKRYGIYVILDMHVIPGGQDPASYCAGGHDLFWTDPGAQERFIALWCEIARRYRDRPEVAAYELMNEPCSKQKTPEWLHSIDQRAITAIRAVAPDKIIVVGGDEWSNPSALTDAMKLPDTNILYTFHWYIATGDRKVTLPIDRAAFQKKMDQAAKFAAKFKVPVWVGEFGCDASSKDYQTQWVNTSVSLFEQNGFSWTYWNDKEAASPEGMGLQAEHQDGSDYPVNETLLAALRAGWALNQPL